MAQYKQLMQQIEALKKQAEEVRQREIAEVIKDIKAMMDEYGITPADLGFSVVTRGSKTKVAAPVKFRNPSTGDTWTGKGRAPKWIQDAEANGQSRDQFLI